MSDRLLSVTEAARVAGVAPVVVRQWCQRGLLRAVKVPRQGEPAWRIDPDDLAAWLARREQTTMMPGHAARRHPWYAAGDWAGRRSWLAW